MSAIPVAFIAGGLNVGGAERQLLYLVREMDRTRFTPLVINLRRESPLTPEFRASGAELVELGYRGKRDVWVIGRIGQVLRSRGVQVACPYLWPATLWGYFGMRRAGVRRWIASERNSGAVYDPRWQVALESLILARATALVAITEAARDFAVSRGVPAERVTIIHVGVPAPQPTRPVGEVRRELGIDAAAPVVGCVARLAPQKGHATFLRAAADVARRIPDARFLIVGDGELRGELEAMSARLGLEERVRFTGMRGDAPDLLNAFDVAVLASGRQEGCSNFLVEAALLGKPVVATRIGGIPEAVVHDVTGVLVPPADPAAMADAIVRLVGDRELARRLGLAAAARAREQFGLRAMVDAWEGLLTTVAHAS